MQPRAGRAGRAARLRCWERLHDGRPGLRAPEVPWLEDWSRRIARSSTAATERRCAAAQHDEWWRIFDDPVLDQLVAEAQRLNPACAPPACASWRRAPSSASPAARCIRSCSRSAARPCAPGRTQSRRPDTGVLAATASAFDIAWELDFWGKFRRGIESADAAYFASIAQYDDVQVLVAAQAASLYASIRTIELRLRIAHENAALQKRSLEITERLFRSGNESELDVQQARSQYLSTLATIPELESSLRQTQNALSVLLARPPGALPEMAAGREQIPEAPLEVIVDLPADLLRRRPDVRAAEMQLAAQSAQIGVSEAALYPSIALAGSVGLSATSLGSSSTHARLGRSARRWSGTCSTTAG